MGLSACSTSPEPPSAQSGTTDSASVPVPFDAHFRFDPVLKDPHGSEAPVSHEGRPKPVPVFDDLLKLQQEIAARNPASDEDKLRLALLQGSVGNLEEAERILSTVRIRTSNLVPYVDLFLCRRLGDHKEAAKLLARFADEDRLATGFMIERAEHVSRVRRFRDYTIAESDRVAPGAVVHLYVEPRNFSLQRVQDSHLLHLKYEWKLYDDRSMEQPMAAWERATVEEREDRIFSNGPISEFYQSFRLPLPVGLAMGHYRVKVTVTDAHTGKSDCAYVPIHVTAGR